MKTAIIIDGGYLLRQIHKVLGKKQTDVTALDVMTYAHSLLDEKSSLFRIYYYDCYPLRSAATNPISGEVVNFHDSRTFRWRSSLYDSLKNMPGLAFRKGVLRLEKGRMILNKKALKEYKLTGKLDPDKISFDINQKQIDIKMGLDIAWIASNKISERIIYVGGDTDIIPAFKHARVEGV